jgi:uncharacterized protein (TIGR02001 family)
MHPVKQKTRARPGLSLRRAVGFVAAPVAAAALFLGLALPAVAQSNVQSQSIALTPPDPPPEGPGIEIPGTGLTVTTTVAVSNDYLFRGISQTRNTWAAQGTVDIAHESGFYVGAFLTNATFLASPYNDTRQEVDALAGYRFTLGGVNLDIGYVGYFYPGQTKPEGTQLNQYNEVMLKANYTIDIVKLMGTFAWSPNFFGRSGNGYYLEGGVDVTLPWEFTAFGRVGYQWIERTARFGTPDYLWYGVGIQREVLLGFTAAVGWYGTNISKRECVPVAERADGGQRICEGRVLFTMSKTF